MERLMPNSKLTLLLGLSVVLLGGCSVLLDWSEDSLPCDGARRCANGYSCLGTTCVADESVGEGDTCNQDRQCDGDLVCSSEPYFACRKRCNAFFEFTSDCGAGEYCRGFDIMDETGVVAEMRGACVPSDCNDDDDCSTGDLCVKITSTASACQQGCQVTFNGTTYSDNCGSTVLEPRYCQPMGAQDAQRLVCLRTSATAQGAGDRCSPVKQPCRSSFACVNETCEEYCKAPTGEQCAGSETCTAKTNSNPSYAVCE